MDAEIIKQSNYITNARYNFSEYEMKVLIRIIKDIQEKLTSKNPEFNKTLFGDIEHKVNFFLADIDPDNTKRVRQALYDLRIRSFSVEDDKRWFECGFINSAEYIKSTQKYEVRISPLLMPYMVSTAKGYTLYQLETCLKLSKYSKRLYMLFAEFGGTGVFRITAEKLRENLGGAEGYKKYKDFKTRILMASITDINVLNEIGACDVRVALTNDKKKSLQNDWERVIEFHVASPQHVKAVLPEMSLEYNAYLNNILKAIFKANIKMANLILTAVGGHRRISEFVKRLERIEDQYVESGRSLTESAGLVVAIAKEYGYTPTTKGKKV